MPMFRKKPIQIEARKYNGTNGKKLSEWSQGKVEPAYGIENGGAIRIHTLEGTLWAQVGDYIVKGIQGGFYAVKPDIFHATYEEIDIHLLGADHGTD